METIPNAMVLEFEVNNQTITRKDNFKVVANSVNYLYAHFTFKTNDYANLTKYGVFKYENDIYEIKLDSDDKCIIPNNVIRPTRFDVGVKGVIGNITTLIPTNYVFVGVMYGTNDNNNVNNGNNDIPSDSGLENYFTKEQVKDIIKDIVKVENTTLIINTKVEV